jgi:hypothetical protein
MDNISAIPRHNKTNLDMRALQGIGEDDILRNMVSVLPDKLVIGQDSELCKRTEQM